MTPEDRSARQREVWAGQRMRDFLNDELMVRHIEGLLHGWQNRWLDAEDVEERERLWARSRALRDFVESLQSVVTTGEMAAAQLNEESGNG